MKLSRRHFFGLTGSTLLGTMAGSLIKPDTALAAKPLKIKDAKEFTTICPYCAVGCGQIVHTMDGKIINIEGDPDHPINEGSLCSKGSALFQVAVNERRLTKVLHREPGSDKWEEMEWDAALSRIAQLIKGTRDESFRPMEDDGRLVNRTEGIACLGGAALDNEECYLYSKLARAMGIVYLEHQARI